MTAIAWSTIQPAIKALFASLAELPAALVIWDGEPMPFAPAPGFAIGDVQDFSATSRGQADTGTFEEAAPDGVLNETITTTRELTLRFRVRVYSNLAPAQTARQYLERMRPRLQYESTNDTLAEIGLGLIAAVNLANLSTTKDDRVTSTSVLDVRFTLLTSDTDPTPFERITTIGDVTRTGV